MRRILAVLAAVVAVLGLAPARAEATTGPNAITTFAPAGIGTPQSIVAGPDGNLWFVTLAAGPDRIGQITPAGVVTFFDDSNLLGINDIAVGPDNHLWFTNRSGNTVGEIDPAAGSQALIEQSIEVHPTGVAGPARPHSIVAGPDGHLWFTLDTNGASGDDDYVIEMTTAGVTTAGTRYQSPVIDQPQDIVAGPDGNLWFTSLANDLVVKVTTAGAMATFAGSAHIDAPQGITVGPDNALWLTSLFNDKIARVTTAGTISSFTHPEINSPQDITSGPDGRLWFTTEDFPDRIMRMATNGGQVGSFDDVATVVDPVGITSGPDGNIWFTSGGQLARLSIPRCSGQIATVLLGPDGYGAPTGGNDVIVGTRGANTINAGAGTDRVCGLAGNDALFGQGGNGDILIGSTGADRLDGGPGSGDTCRGGLGTDTRTGCEIFTGIP